MARRIRRTLSGLLLATLLLGATPAVAHDHESEYTGHPLRVGAYLLHPFGVLLETLFMKPAHWLGHREPWRTIFGHTDRYN